MGNAAFSLAGLGFWLAVAIMVSAVIWSVVRSRQMKHELKLKILEKGQDLDPALLERLLEAEARPAQLPPKSVADQNREAGGTIGFIFLVAGLMFAFVGMIREAGLSWPLIGLGIFSFAFGYLCWHNTMREYVALRAEEKAAAARQDQA